jgi:esterase
MQLNYREYGNGEPLIILHGLLGSSDNWHSTCERLAEFLRVFALDQRSHGRSPHTDEMNYPAMAEDIRDFLARQGLERAHVLGHSMGGKTAMQFALLFPEKVSQLIVVDISPRKYPPKHETLLAALLALALDRYQTRKQIEEALAPSIPDLALRQFLLMNLARNSGGAFHWKIGLRQIHHNYQRLREAIDAEHPFPRSTLFIRGERSEYLVEQDMPAIQRLFPQARLQTIAGSNHLVHSENPPAFLAAVVEFLREPQTKRPA